MEKNHDPLPELDDKEILSQVSEKVLQESVTITVDIRPSNWFESIMQRMGLMKSKRVFTVHPITMGTLLRISKYLLSIKVDMSVKDLRRSYMVISEHAETMATIIAIAIQNSKRGPDKKLINLIMDNFKSKELLGVCAVILYQMDPLNFLNTITSMTGLNILESRDADVQTAKKNGVSPSTQGSYIAPGILSEQL